METARERALKAHLDDAYDEIERLKTELAQLRSFLAAEEKIIVEPEVTGHTVISAVKTPKIVIEESKDAT